MQLSDSIKYRTLPVPLELQVYRELENEAKNKQIAAPQLASTIVLEYLADKNDVFRKQAEQQRAEIRLMGAVNAIITAIANEDRWDEHVTAQIFDRIKAEHLSDYHDAIQAGNKARVNRQIGSAVKDGLNATVVTKNGKRVHKRPSIKNLPLIQSYTLLTRSK